MKVCDEFEESMSGMVSVQHELNRKETSEMPSSKKKKKVWTRLKNGLFGWRVVATPREKTVKAKNASFPELSLTSNSKFTPAIISGIKTGLPKSESGEHRIKRKYFGDNNDRAGCESESLAGKKKR